MPSSRSIALILALAACAAVTSCTSPGGPVNAQNWSDRDRYAWYRGSQGSRLVPYAWLIALEDGDGRPFMRPETTLKYKYLPAAAEDPSQLPIGFAIDTNRHGAKLVETDLHWYAGQSRHEPWVGMNCAACHTAELIVNDRPLRVDGGPTLADFEGFTNALRAALIATADDPARWDRFAGKVLAAKGARDTPANRSMLKAAFTTYLTRERELARLNEKVADDPAYGPGRLDAVGRIFNKVAYLATAGRPAARSQFGGPPGAPVSYPFLWNVPQQAQLQWNGIAPNKPIRLLGRTALDAGALVRNAGEVIGVFADVGVPPPQTGRAKLAGYRSSIDVSNLGKMEQQLRRLKSPPWPGALDPKLVSIGDGLFKTHCAACHNELSRDDLTAPARERMIPIWGPGGVGTDIWMACNAYTFQARAGNLAGVPATYLFGSPIEPIDDTRSMLTAVAVGALAGKKGQIVETALSGLFEDNQRPTVVSPMTSDEQKDRAERERRCRAAWADTSDPKHDRALLQYKARPLNGIWATGPYLHNGSVRTLWELLLDPAKRSASFNVGTRKLDVKDVGYVDEPVPGGWVFRARDESSRTWLSGNDNRGHDYGNGLLSDDDRRALVEYMKSL